MRNLKNLFFLGYVISITNAANLELSSENLTIPDNTVNNTNVYFLDTKTTKRRFLGEYRRFIKSNFIKNEKFGINFTTGIKNYNKDLLLKKDKYYRFNIYGTGFNQNVKLKVLLENNLEKDKANNKYTKTVTGIQLRFPVYDNVYNKAFIFNISTGIDKGTILGYDFRNLYINNDLKKVYLDTFFYVRNIEKSDNSNIYYLGVSIYQRIKERNYKYIESTIGYAKEKIKFLGNKKFLLRIYSEKENKIGRNNLYIVYGIGVGYSFGTIENINNKYNLIINDNIIELAKLKLGLRYYIDNNFNIKFEVNTRYLKNFNKKKISNNFNLGINISF